MMNDETDDEIKTKQKLKMCGCMKRKSKYYIFLRSLNKFLQNNKTKNKHSYVTFSHFNSLMGPNIQAGLCLVLSQFSLITMSTCFHSALIKR